MKRFEDIETEGKKKNRLCIVPNGSKIDSEAAVSANHDADAAQSFIAQVT